MMNIALKIIAIISVVYGIIVTFLGPLSFTYFTILSNIFIAVVLSIFLVNDIRKICGIKISYNESVFVAKFLATVSITITFLVFMFLLAPTMEGGIINAYVGDNYGSFCLHFLTPVLAIIDFFLFDRDFLPNKKHAIYAIIPPLVYFGYVIILSFLGVRWGTMSAPYNFINYAAPTGWFGFDLNIIGWESLGIGVFYMVIILFLIFIALGLIFIKIKKILAKKK